MCNEARSVYSTPGSRRAPDATILRSLTCFQVNYPVSSYFFSFAPTCRVKHTDYECGYVAYSNHIGTVSIH